MTTRESDRSPRILAGPASTAGSLDRRAEGNTASVERGTCWRLQRAPHNAESHLPRFAREGHQFESEPPRFGPSEKATIDHQRRRRHAPRGERVRISPEALHIETQALEFAHRISGSSQTVQRSDTRTERSATNSTKGDRGSRNRMPQPRTGTGPIPSPQTKGVSSPPSGTARRLARSRNRASQVPLHHPRGHLLGVLFGQVRVPLHHLEGPEAKVVMEVEV